MAEKIVIASGKGGVGKSSLTAGLARALSNSGKRVLMLDMDIGLRSLDLIFGTQRSFSLTGEMYSTAAASRIRRLSPRAGRC